MSHSSPTSRRTSPAERLQTSTAAVRLSLRWFGVRKTLSPEQKAEAAEAFGAAGEFLSAGKKLLDTRHPAYGAGGDLMELVITPVGDVRCLYDESLDLTSLGSVHIQRGSHVEPDRVGHWFADMSPVGGLSLGPSPRRSDALNAEVAWLRDHWLLPPMVSDSSALV